MLVPPSRAFVLAVVAFAPSIMLTVPKTPIRRITIATRTSTSVMPPSSWRAGERDIPSGIGSVGSDLEARATRLAASRRKRKGRAQGPAPDESARVVGYQVPPALQPP